MVGLVFRNSETFDFKIGLLKLDYFLAFGQIMVSFLLILELPLDIAANAPCEGLIISSSSSRFGGYIGISSFLPIISFRLLF